MRTIHLSALFILMFSAFCHVDDLVADWRTHTVRQTNGGDGHFALPARFQILSTENWGRVMTIPYTVYMPERDRMLMLVNCDYPHRAFTLTSDDRGANWTDPRPTSVDKNGKPSAGLGTSLAYLGDGKALFYAGQRWFSRDYGKAWGDTVPIAPTSDGKPWTNGQLKSALKANLPLSPADRERANHRPNEEKWEELVNNALSPSRGNSLYGKDLIENVDRGVHRLRR